MQESSEPGQVLSLTTQSGLHSFHGSASPYDLHAVLIGRGPSFQAGLTSDLPTGAVDLLLTSGGGYHNPRCIGQSSAYGGTIGEEFIRQFIQAAQGVDDPPTTG
jgi:hypothetical protein